MREILFRGKRADNGEWVEGYYSTSGNYECIMKDALYDHYIVDPSTVGQFTGLLDKDGKRIFEGDVVRDIDDGGLRSVAYVSGAFWTFARDTMYDLMGNCNGCLEVVGNVHDNPELIGGEEG